MKIGELIILWVGGLLSAALLIVTAAPTSTRSNLGLGEPLIAGYVFNLVTKLLVIWIGCGLVWLTLYRRGEGD
jgi:hypothetical protein